MDKMQVIENKGTRSEKNRKGGNVKRKEEKQSGKSFNYTKNKPYRL